MHTVLLLLLSNCFSAIPTVEGLFRNGNNQKVAGNISILSAFVTNLEDEDALKEMASSKKSPEQREGQYVKLIFFRVNEEKFQILQGLYDSAKMDEKSLIEVNFIPHILKKTKKEQKLSRSLFYSLMIMFAFNDSTGIKKLLKKYNNGFKENKEIMNKDKTRLYNDYRNYLLALKKNKDLKNELVSPFRPQDEKEREKADKLLSSSMYKNTGHVKLVRRNNRFFWEVNLRKAHALFTNEKYRLHYLQLHSPDGEVEVNAGDYFLSNGNYELPKILIFKDEFFRYIHFRMINMRVYDRLKRNLPTMARDYKKKLAKRKDKDSDIKEVSPVSIFYHPK